MLGTAAMCALGIAITTITTTTNSASAIAPFSMVILSFISDSGVFIPIDQLPDSLVQLGKVFPLAHLAAGLQGAFGGASVQLSEENTGVPALWGRSASSWRRGASAESPAGAGPRLPASHF